MSLQPPDFGLSIVDGRGRLGLRSPARVGPLTIEKLELDLAVLRSPLDFAAGASGVRHRRGDLRAAILSVDEEAIAAWLADRQTAFAGFGLSEVTGRVGQGALFIGFMARVGDHAVEGTAQITLNQSDRRSIALAVDDVRLYGYSPVAAPLWGLALAQGALGPASIPGGPSVTALGEVTIDPLDLTLWRALPMAGFRLPSLGAIRIGELRSRDERVEIEFRADGDSEDHPALSARARRCPAGDELLAANCLDEALSAYRAAAAIAPHPELTARALSILVASPWRWSEASRIAHEALDGEGHGASSAASAARLALAVIEGEGQDSNAAATHYTELAFAAQRAGEREDERAALRRAAALFLASDPERATPALERLLSLPPSGPETATARAALARVAERLAERYLAEDRIEDLERLERRRVTLAEGPEAAARIHLRLAGLWLDRNHDRARAREALKQALHLSPRSVEGWELAVRLNETLADRPGALAALDRLIDLRAADPNPGAAAAAATTHLRAAALLEAAGDVEAALGRCEIAALLDPTSHAAHAGVARLLVKLDRHGEADAAYERSLAALPDGEAHHPACRRVLLEWAVAAQERSDPESARSLLFRAAALGEHRDVLAAIAEQAHADRRLDEADRALARLVDLGDSRASLRRAALLIELGRPDEARALAVAARSPDASATDRIVADACAALGDLAGQRAALDRLLGVVDTPALRLELFRLSLAAGDLVAAENLLGSAGDGIEVLAARCELLAQKRDDAALADALGELASRRLDEGAAHDSIGASHALASRGAALLRLQHLEPAAAAFRHALRLAESDEARAGLAEAAWRLRRWDEARSAAEPLFQRGAEPRAEIALRLGVISERLGDTEAARRFFRSALDAGAVGHDAVRAHDGLIAILSARGESDAAIQALLTAADDPHSEETVAARAGRLVAAAGLLRRKGRPDEALPIYERALTLDAHTLGALDALEALAAGDAERVASILARKVVATSGRPSDQKAILARLGRLQADRLGRPDEARATFRRVLAIDPAHRPSLRWLAAAARAADDRAEETDLLSLLATLPAEPAATDVDVELCARLASLLVENGDDAGAERAATRALASAPHQPAALEILDGILTRAERIEELELLLGRRLEAESGFDRSLHLAWRRAALLERLDRRDEAVRTYDQILHLRPTSARAWERLAALHRAAGAWPELALALERLADRRAADGESREAATLFIEAARTARDELRDLDRTANLLRQALSLDGRSTAALDGLLALARARGDREEEETLLSQRILAEDDPARRDALMAERAALHRMRGDLDAALEGLRSVSLESSGAVSLQLRAEIAEEIAAWSEAATAIAEQARRARRAADVDGEHRAVSELARVTRDLLGNHRAAEPLFRRALELDPSDIAAADALVDLVREGGDLPSLLATQEQQLEAVRRSFGGPAREAELCVEIARVLRLSGDHAGAEIRLHEALEVEPRHAPALVILGELHLERGEATAALQALELAIEADPDPGIYALLVVAWEEHGDSGKAAAALEWAGDAIDPAWRAGVLERAGRDEEALDVWRGLGGDAGARGAASILLGRAQEMAAQGQRSEAAFWARQALHEGPCDPSALSLAAYDLDGDALWVLAERAAAQQIPSEAALTWREAAELAQGPARREALRRSIAASPTVAALVALAVEHGGDEGATWAQQAVEIDPTSIEAALAWARGVGDEDSAAAIAHLAALVADAPNERRPGLTLAVARLRLARGEVAEARETLERAVAEGARGDEFLEAIRSLIGLDDTIGDHAAAERHLDLLAADGAATEDDLRRLADRRSARGDHVGAVVLLRRAGGETASLCAALEAAEDFAELVDVLAESAERAPPIEAVAMLRRAASIAENKLDDPRRAALVLERAADIGADAHVWIGLGRLHAERLDDAEFAALCFSRARAVDHKRADAPALLGELHLRRGELDVARNLFEEALALGVVEGTLRDRVTALLGEIADRSRDGRAAESMPIAVLAAGGKLLRSTPGPSKEADSGDRPTGVPSEKAIDSIANNRAAVAPVAAALGTATDRALPGETIEITPSSATASLDDPEFATVGIAPNSVECADASDGRAAIEERLNADVDGPERIQLLRRMLSFAMQIHDDGLTDRAARELLAAVPDDAAAFAERRRILVSRSHDSGLAALLRERAATVADIAERTELLIGAGRASERFGDVAAAIADYESALRETPGDATALEALADLSYRAGDVAHASTLYAHLEGQPLSLAPAEIARRRGELAETEGLLDEAAAHYRDAIAADPARPAAHEALLRVALARSTTEATYAALKEAAALLPREAASRLTDLRMRLGELALDLGLASAARQYLEAVLAHEPERVPALLHLADLYAAANEWEACADVHGRLAYLADAPLERAELTFRQGEIFRLQLHDLERANAAYLRAADLAPRHLPTLRRLIAYYLGEGDLVALAEVVGEVEALGASLGDSAVEAGLGLAYAGDADGAQRYLEGARPHELAAAIASLTALTAESLDVALAAATLVFAHERSPNGGDEDPMQRAFERLLIDDPGDEGARLALGRRAELDGEMGRARAHYAVLAWIDPFSPGAKRLAQLGSPTVTAGAEPVHPDAVGPLGEALRMLGPRVLGLVAARAGAVPEPAWNIRLQAIGVALDFSTFFVASVDALDDPAVAEPTAPPRLLLRRSLLNDPAAVAFAAARALHLLRAGVSLIDGRSDEDVAALLAAAAALFNPDVRPTSPFARAWLAELRALPLRSEGLAPAARSAMRSVLPRAFQPDALARRAVFTVAERLTANRVAYLVQGDLAAALRALAPIEIEPSRRARAAALSGVPAIADLVAYATSPDGRRRIR